MMRISALKFLLVCLLLASVFGCQEYSRPSGAVGPARDSYQPAGATGGAAPSYDERPSGAVGPAR